MKKNKYDVKVNDNISGFYEWNKPTYIIDKNDKRYNKFVQVKRQTGVSPDQTWDLYGNICIFLIPRLKAYRDSIKKFGCHPCCVKNNRTWVNIINKMIWTFQQIDKMDDNFISDKDKRKRWQKKVDEGFNLFNKYFCNLWW